MRDLSGRERRPGRPGSDESGFTLIEMVIAVGLLALILPALAELFVGSSFAAAHARLREVATTVADSALDKARAVLPASDLLSEGVSVSAAPTGVDFSNTSGVVELAPQTTTLDNRVFTADLYAGTCYLQSDGKCTTATDTATMVRVIADVTWAAPSCGTGGCYYVASTLISNADDPVLNVNPNAAPGTPTGVTATPGKGQVTLSWSAPVSDYPITGYTVTATNSSTGASAGTCTATSSTSCTVSGLTNGTDYSFIVVATSAGGTSNASSPVTSVPTDAPSVPTGVVATAGNAQVAVSWTASQSDYTPVTYTVTATGGATGSCTTTSTSCTVTGLTNSVTYSVTVTASSSGGTSPASAAVTATPSDPPNAPTGVGVSAGTSQVAVSWTAPSSDYPISGYTVTATNASSGASAGTCVTSSTGCTVTGLTNGTTYSFSVTARSSGGTSPSSAPVDATPLATVPAAPTSVQASVTTQGRGRWVTWTVTVNWSESTSPITGYTITATDTATGATAGTWTSSTTSVQITSGLSTSSSYTFKVTATNGTGTSAASAASNAVTP